jgi:Leucine-rich repeat (LRR) protein
VQSNTLASFGGAERKTSLNRVFHANRIMIYLMRCFIFCLALGNVFSKVKLRAAVEIMPFPNTELKALQDLYNATNGQNWVWKSNTTEYGSIWNIENPSANPCTERWQGINCTSVEPLAVLSIELTEYNLNGTLPNTLNALTSLLELQLNGNAVRGPIASSIGEIQNLEVLDLASNKLSGTLPSFLGALTSLRYIDLSYNKLNGTLPSSWGQLENLHFLQITNNLVTGTIPKSFSALCSMLYLNLQNMHLSGTIPANLSCMTDLLYMNLRNNRLTGTLPANLGALSNLLSLQLDSNQLTGTIPPSLGALEQLLLWKLYSNSITGSIPDTIGQMRALSFLDLGFNTLSGSIPASIGNCSYLYFLSVQLNSLSGSLPSEMGELVNLQQILLADNGISGTVPASLGNLDNMLLFMVSDNSLSGSLPASYGGMTSIEYFDVSGNGLTGSLPDTLGSLLLVEELYVYDNFLTGTVPATFGALSWLQELKAYDNILDGSLPFSLQKLGNLTVLLLYGNYLTGTLEGVFNATHQVQLSTVEVSGNQLSGSLPEELFRLPRLLTIAAVSNCFTGALPGNICNCTTLNTIALDGLRSASNCQHKVLIGLSNAYQVENPEQQSLPQCLFKMPALTTLHLSGNSLTGSLPSNVTISASLLDLSLSHNVLTGTIPTDFQRRVWTNLDLSYNRLAGILSEDFFGNVTDSSLAGTSLSLDNNRLSGGIPGVIPKSSGAVSILSSNLFSCRVDRSDLPQQDSDVGNYQCGSASFNAPFFIWLGVAVAAAVWFLVSHFRLVENCSAFTVEALRTLRKWDGAAECGDETLALTSRLQNYREAVNLFHGLCVVSVSLALFAVIILAPLYATLSYFYGTVTYQSAYLLSAGLLSGPVPFALMFVALSALAALVVYTFVAVLRVHLVSGSTLPDQVDGAEIGGRPVMERFAVYTAYIVVNLTVVVGVNAAYVYVALYQSEGVLLTTQLLMSFFKLFWNKFCSNFLVLAISNYLSNFEAAAVRQYSREFLSVQLVVTLFNNVAVPCLVVAVISPNCFYNALVAAPQVRASYEFLDCTDGFNPNTNKCNQSPTPGTTSYSPPFTYSYQCSATFVTYYAPAFVYLCITASIVVPLTHFVIYQLNKRVGKDSELRDLPQRLLPPLLKGPVTSDGSVVERNRWKPLFEANNTAIVILTYLGILLTFGAVFPPLAATMAVTIVVTVVVMKVILGRWILRCIESKQLDSLAVIEAESVEVNNPVILSNAVWLLITFSCWFYTLFLFDTLGDAVGLQQAYWVLIVMPLLPAVLYCAVLVVTHHSGARPAPRSATTTDVAVVELASNPIHHEAR